MLVLGIETSCDETAAAVLRDGNHLLANIIASQNEIHSPYGGIVPELASRCHIDRIDGVIQEALSQAGATIDDLDLIAVTAGPGLIGSLLVGVNASKAIAYATGKPLIAINHLEGHLLAIFLQEPVAFPFLALIVSGGHTELCRVDGFGSYRLLGQTLDDAAGESFDKVAKMLGLGYPGGPIIERLARQGDPEAFDFPRALMSGDSLDFSFSGLKSSVRRLLEKRTGELQDMTKDVAASFQTAVTDVLVTKALRACEQEGLERLVLTGGVAANGFLRQRLGEATGHKGIAFHAPRPVFCTDNAAMIACAGYHAYRRDPGLACDPVTMDASAQLSV